MTEYIKAEMLKSWISDDVELALLDVREAGQFGEDHMLHAIPCPYSIIEARVLYLVPRRSTRLVLIDDADGTGEKAIHRLTSMGYENISILEGGNAAWSAAGFEVFQGVNVPSKAFGELVEHAADTPRISAEQLHHMLEQDENLVVVDGRTPMEHRRMSIPGGISMPNAEMIYRIHDLAPDPETTVVVNCAGRTRSIIGAQALINAGLPNRVFALKAGTMGWTLAGYQLEHGSKLTHLPQPSEQCVAKAAVYAADIIEVFGLATVNRDTLRKWQEDDQSTVFLLDVRTESEYAKGHLPGSVHAPGGQLVQATDEWCGVWGARVVLADTAPCARAAITAHWLKQMGWDVYILDGGLTMSEAKERGRAPRWGSAENKVQSISPHDLSKAIHAKTVLVIDVGHSMDYRDAHIPGAVWSTRARLDGLEIPARQPVVLYSKHETRARLAAIDLEAISEGPVAILQGGREAWIQAGLPIEASPDVPADRECIDYLFWVSSRHMGSNEAALAYLEWEENLPSQIEADGDARFNVMTR